MSQDMTAKAAIEKAIYRAIFDDPAFTIDAPKLTPALWERVSIRTPGNMKEIERLEFLGDSLMDASIAIALYNIVPDGTPHKYTVMLSSLHANRTFCHLARKMEIEHGGADTKNIGDVFETIVGAYYTEKGFDAVHQWALRIYEPLVQEASVAFDTCTTQVDRNSTPHKGEVDTSFSKGKGKARRRSSTTQGRPTDACSSRSQAPQRSSVEGVTRGFPPAISAVQSTSPTEARSLHRGSSFHTRSTENYTSDQSSSHRTRRFKTDSNSDDEPLPEFWEKIRLDDGQVVFLDHTTEKTTWEDPRRGRTPSPSPEAVPDAWRARLVAGSEDMPDDQPPTARTLSSYDDVFPDLVNEGYTASTAAPSSLSPHALPEFWELRQGRDGKTYYIDHTNATFMEST